MSETTFRRISQKFQSTIIPISRCVLVCGFVVNNNSLVSGRNSLQPAQRLERSPGETPNDWFS